MVQRYDLSMRLYNQPRQDYHELDRLLNQLSPDRKLDVLARLELEHSRNMLLGKSTNLTALQYVKSKLSEGR